MDRAIALAIEFLDELVFGIREASWPAIRSALGLSYAWVGILLTVPSLLADAIEPFMALAGAGARRRRFIALGGVVFAAALVGIAAADNAVLLLLGFVVLYPASGAFVSLTQASLMDDENETRERSMAFWVFAGSLGVVVGPLVVAAAFASGVGWRPLFAGCAIPALLLVVASRRRGTSASDGVADRKYRDGLQSARTALRQPAVVRWLAVLQFTDLLGDVLAGFLALYFVDVTHASITQAAAAVVVWTVAGLVGDGLLIPLLARVRGTTYLRGSALAMLVAYPAFLLVNAQAARVILLAVVSLLRAGWYAIPQAQLYEELHDDSSVALAVSNVAGIAGGAVPLILGLAAQAIGLSRALWLCALAPVAVLLLVPRGAGNAPTSVGPTT